jgi:hypothetical protein
MAMILQKTRLRLTQAIYFGKPSAGGSVSISSGSGITTAPNPITGIGTVSVGPLSTTWNAGAYPINSQNSSQVFNVKSYGALGDGQVITDGAMLVGSAHLTSASNPFVVGDVGKVITVDGGAAAGKTLVTTIQTFNGAGDVTLASGNASGVGIAGKIAIWGTSDIAAFNSAVAAASAASGGIVQIDGGRYMLPSSLVLDSKSGITLRGISGMQAGGTTGSQLIFTQAAGQMISAQPISNALHLELLNIRIENTAFTGSVIKVTGSNFHMDECIVDGGGSGTHGQPGAFTAVDLTGAVTGIYQIHRVNFTNGGGICINGDPGGATNVAAVRGCQFSGYSITNIKNLGQAASIVENNFEGIGISGSANIACGGIIQEKFAGLSIRDNWFGDNTDTATVGQAWITLSNGSGADISGNMIGLNNGIVYGAGTATCIKFSTTLSTAVSIHGNDLGNGTSIAGTTGVDGGGLSHKSIWIGPNRNACATKVTGFTASTGVFEEPTSGQVGVGTSQPDITASYASTAGVLGVGTPSAFYSVAQIQGNYADGDNVIVGNVDFAQKSQTVAANKRMAVIQGITQGTTANNRGGAIVFYTKADAGSLAAAGAWSKDAFLGVNTITPTRQLDINGTQRWRGIAAPAVSEANSGTIYFDSATNKLKASLNGSAYVDVIGSGGLTGSGAAGRVAYWDTVASVASPTDIYVDVVNNRLGLNVAAPGYQLDMTGELNLGTASAVIRNAGSIVMDVGTIDLKLGGSHGTLAGGDTAIGSGALANSNGAGTGNNTAVGLQAGGHITSGGSNTVVGELAGSTLTTGSDNTLIGMMADTSVNNLTNAIAIGSNAVVAVSNGCVLGDANTKVGVRTTTPTATLDLDGEYATRHKNKALVNGLNSDIALSDTSWLRITGPVGAFSVGGFTGGVDGRRLTIFNTVAFQMTIVNNDGLSAATNRITTLTGGDVVLRAGTSSASFIYEDVSDTWVLVATN